MKLNAPKTKEMRVNFSSSSPSYPPIVTNNQTVSIVKHAKLLSVIISNDLKWNLHVNAICKKASKHLYALWLLKIGMPFRTPSQSRFIAHVLDLSLSTHVKRGNNLPVYLNNQIEQIQKRALRIIYPSFTYNHEMLTANVLSLYDLRSIPCEQLFHRMLDPGHKLNSLVPALTNTIYAIIDVLRFQFNL
jgi:hypothetical protein